MLDLMYYEELISHLYNIKILTHLDQYKITIDEYFNQIVKTSKLETELKLLENPSHLTDSFQTKQSIINFKAKISVGLHKEKVQLKLEKLLSEAGFKNAFFGSFLINLDNLLTLSKTIKYIEFLEYIFGNPRFKKQLQNIKPNRQIVNEYKLLVESNITDDFISFLSLLQELQIGLDESLDVRVKIFTEALKTVQKENKDSLVKQTYSDLEEQIKQSDYILVGTALKSSNTELVDLAVLIQRFTKANGIDFNSFQSQQEQILRFFSDLYFSKYIKETYFDIIENVGLNPNEVHNLIQSRNKLNKVIYPDNIESFRAIEKQLVNEEYFDKKGYWHADKQNLIGFILECESKGYLKIKLNSNNRLIVRRFFEERYLVDISKIFQPNQIAKLSHLRSKFNWIKKAS